MKVCVIGTGYVGLVTGTCLAEMGNEVICVDNNPEKIQKLKNGHVPIYEPGLEELIQSNTSEGRLEFTTDLAHAVQESLICIIAVGTPQGEDGSADLSCVMSVARAIASIMDGYRVIVTKSTVPVGTGDEIETMMAQATRFPFAVVSNPEFLKQGAAVDDFLKPDRVVIGTTDQRATDIMRDLYQPFLRTGNPILFMDRRSAEMTKYAANAFLATKISFINEISNLCERVKADVSQVQAGIATDTRIGSHFLFPGLGYGGSCFPKDVRALIRTARVNGTTMRILEEVDSINQQQRLSFLSKIFSYFSGSVTGKTIAVWGLAFKPRTDDMREAPSIPILETLLSHGARIRVFDPKAMDTAWHHFADMIDYCDNAYDALDKADALLLLTEWNEFRRPNFERVKEKMRSPVIFDGRNQYDTDRMAQRGFLYFCMGRNAHLPSAAVSIEEKEVLHV